MPRPFLFRCSACGARNNIPADKIGRTGRCGKCKAPLNTSLLKENRPLVVSDANFDDLVMRSPLPVLLDCWAAWCDACKSLTPLVHAIAAESQGRLRVGKLNVDANPRLSARFDLRSIPTLLIFDNGRLQDTLTGALPKPIIMQHLARYLR